MFNREIQVSHVLLASVAFICSMVSLPAISASHSGIVSTAPVADSSLTKDDIIFYIHQQLEDPVFECSDRTVLKRHISVRNAILNAGNKLMPLLCEVWDAPERTSDELGEIVSLASKLNGDVSCLVPKVSRRLENRSDGIKFVNSTIEFLGKHGRDQDIDVVALMLNDNDTNQDRYIGHIREKVIDVLAERGAARHLPVIENFVTGGASAVNSKLKEQCNYAIGRINIRSLEQKLKEEKSEQSRSTLEHRIKQLRAKYPTVHQYEQNMTLNKLLYGSDSIDSTNQPQRAMPVPRN